VSAPRQARPNLLFITVDTLRADHLGCYGFARARTPNMDRLAAEGIRVQEARAPTPLTLPSHTSLMTGLEPPAHGVRNNGHDVPDEVQTLAESLKAEGYQTQAFVSAEVLHRRFNLDQGFDGYDDELSTDHVLTHERSGKETVDGVVTWLSARSDLAAAKAPFFLWVHLFDPHWPYTPPAAEARNAATPYDGEIAAADRQIGRILALLKSQRLLDDTLIVLTSDHGESLGEHGETSHAILIYESTIRVPLIFRQPHKLPAKAYHGPVRSVDVMPTVLGLLGVQAPKTQGLDLSDALLGRAAAPTPESYAESFYAAEVYGAASLHGLRSDHWTYIRAPRRELYDRRSDPGELKNLLSDADSDSPEAKAARERADDLDARLGTVLEQSGGMGIAAVTSPIDAHTAEMLQALGYAEGSKSSGGLEGMDAKDVVRIDARFDRGVELLQENKPVEGLGTLEALLQDYPRLRNVRHVLARAYRQAGDLEGAERHYRVLLDEAPEDAGVYVQLAQLELRGGGALDKARTLLGQAIERSPESVNALMLMAELEAREGHPEDAKRLYGKVIEIDPTVADAYFLYGQLLYSQRDFAEALRRYQQFLERSPHHFLGNLRAGVCELQLQKLDAAKRHFEQAARSEPKAWQPALNIACVHALQGQTDPALTRIEEAIAKGFSNFEWMGQNPCWASLRDDPRFRALPNQRRSRSR
jgi:choline-sulfatase